MFNLLLFSHRSWKKQLNIAKDARRVDVLCHRIFLSYRLLDGTSRFNELHDYVKEAKSKLETEVGPVDGVSAKMARGIVSRLSVGGDVQRLCSIAVEKAHELMSSKSTSTTNFIGNAMLFLALSLSIIAAIFLILLVYFLDRGFAPYSMQICI